MRKGLVRYVVISIAILIALLSVWMSYSPSEERCLVIVKPDGMMKGYKTVIYDRLGREAHVRLLQEKSYLKASPDILKRHYSEHEARAFFDELIAFMGSGEIAVSIWVGPVGSIASIRHLVGSTDPSKALPHTIRAQLATSSRENVIHASDSVESAEREIQIWFH